MQSVRSLRKKLPPGTQIYRLVPSPGGKGVLVPQETLLTCETYTLACSEAQRLQDVASECLKVLATCSARLDNVRILQKKRVAVAQQLTQTRDALETLAAQVFAKMGPRVQTKIRQDPEARTRCAQRRATRGTRNALASAQNERENETLDALEKEAQQLKSIAERMFASAQ